MRHTINVPKDFSSTPIGRYRGIDGPYCGQVFREDYLVPSLNKHEVTLVDFASGRDGGSSFLEEAFGGLIHTEGFSAETLKQKLVVTGNDPSVSAQVWEYIRRASNG